MSDEAARITKASPRLQARIAGILYLLIILGSLFLPFVIAPSGISGMTLDEANLSIVARIEASKSLYILSGAA